MHGRVTGNEAGGSRGEGGRRCRPALSLLLAGALLVAVPPVAGAVDAGREGGLAMRLTELLDGLWRWATGRLYEGCEEITVSGHRFCLPRDRVVIRRWGRRGFQAYLYLTPLPEGREGERILFSVEDARKGGVVPEGMTVPEYNIRSLARAYGKDEREQAVLWARVQARIREAEDGEIFLLNDIIPARGGKNYVQVRGGRAVRLLTCSTPKKYKNSCMIKVHNIMNDFFIRYSYFDNSNFKDYVNKINNIEKIIESFVTE